jgi:DNA-binding MarR family transcriptional regulator
MDAPSRIANDCLAFRLRRLNRLVTNIYDEALRPLGLRVSQLNILSTAAVQQTARPAELCRLLELDPSTLSRNLQILHRNGWIEYLEDSDDARAQPFRITASGLALIERAGAAWSEAQRRAEDALGRDLAQALRGQPSDIHASVSDNTIIEPTVR